MVRILLYRNIAISHLNVVTCIFGETTTLSNHLQDGNENVPKKMNLRYLKLSQFDKCGRFFR